MAIFRIQKEDISRINEIERFRTERELEDFFSNQNNLKELLGVKFLDRQYEIVGRIGIIDILGLDYDNSPVIIELKLNEGGDSVLAQGQAYYSWLLKNKNSFEHLVEIKSGKDVKVNWEMPKIILLAKNFSNHVKMAVEQLDFVELITYSFYESGVLRLEGEELSSRLLHGKKEGREENKNDNLVFGFSQHMSIIISDEVRVKITLLMEKVLSLPNIKEIPQQTGITYKNKKKFMSLGFRPTWIQLLLKKPAYSKDTRRIIKDINNYKWGYDGLIRFDGDSDVDYVFEIIKEAYEQTQ